MSYCQINKICIVMQQDNMIAGIRFGKTGKIYHFDAAHIQDIRIGDAVVVDTARGNQIGWVAMLVSNVSLDEGEVLKPIVRLANAQDLAQQQILKVREKALVEFCRIKVVENKLVGVKIVDAEFSFDGVRLLIMYTVESEEKIDLKVIKQDVQQIYNGTQIELKQIGPRDMAKCMGGLGACGLENRCCSTFLCDFNSISIRMAKEQGISLTPGEITGICGRLRCCLSYEYDHYLAAKEGMPKRKKMVKTPSGVGKVIDIAPLSGTVIVDIPEVGTRSFHKDEVNVIESEAQEPRKPQQTHQPAKSGKS